MRRDKRRILERQALNSLGPMRRLNHPVYRNRVLQVLADAALVALSFFLAFQPALPRHRTACRTATRSSSPRSVGFVVVGKIVVFALHGLYQKWWRYVSGRDFLLIVRAVAVSSAILVVAFAVLRPFAHNLPRSVAVMDFMLTLMLIAGARLVVRLIVERPSRGAPGAQARGAGRRRRLRRPDGRPRAAAQPATRRDRDRLRRRRPAQARDADAGGLKVLGLDRARSRAILDETEPDEVVIAIPSAPGTLRANVVAACREREIRVRTLPTVFELLRGGVQLNKQLRDVQVEDVLGRDPVVFELDRVGAYLRDRIVLVTGAGGSIGSELCRQIARVGPRLLVMLDHAEDNLFEIDREMVEERHFTSVESVLADCKEPHRMLRGDAALQAERRIPRRRLQARAADGGQPAGGRAQQRDRDPDHGRDRRRLEGRALRPDLDRQGCNPKTVMGASKAMAEWIVEAAGHKHPGTRFAGVRFGNVLASSGSVVPIFRSQIERGGPVTVTHPEMTRYFMTIPEAVQLVIRAGDIGAGKGEVFVLDMGEPVKILDLAHNMIRLAGYEPETRHRGRVHAAAPGREAARGAVRRRGERAADRRQTDSPRRPGDADRPRVGRRHPQFARAHGDGRRRGESGRARGRDDHRAGWGRGDGRLRRVASRSHLRHLLMEIGSYAGLAAFFGLGVLALLSFTPGSRHPPPARVGRLGAGARCRAQGVDLRAAAERAEELRRLEEAREAERAAADLRETRRQRREAGLPELTRAERMRSSLSGGRSRIAEPAFLVGIFLVVVAIGGGVAYFVFAGNGGDTSSHGMSKPAEIEVTVLNGTAVPGLAASYGDRVERKGFKPRRRHQQQLQLQRKRRHVRPRPCTEGRRVAKALGISKVKLELLLVTAPSLKPLPSTLSP